MDGFETKLLKFKWVPALSGQKEHLLVLVHGRTGNLRVLDFITKRFQVPDLNYLIIQAPFEDRREDQKDDGFSWYLKGRERIDESRKLLSDLLYELNDFGFAFRKIYWLGFSQGAAMGLDTYLRFPEALGGVEAVSGLLIEGSRLKAEASKVAKKQRILITHGTRDEIITLDEAKKTFEVLDEMNVPYELKIFDKPHSFQMNQELPFLESKIIEWMRTS